MKRRVLSQIPLFVGLVAGLVALWTGGAPVLGSGDAVLGGHEARWYAIKTIDGKDGGCTVQGSCQYCFDTKWMDCVDYYNGAHPCTGGGGPPRSRQR